MLRKHRLKKKRQLRSNNKLRRLRHIYSLKRRIHARYRVGFMMLQQQA